MQRIKWALALAGILSLAGAANATTNYTCSSAADTWCFVPSSNGQIGNGTTYSSTTGNLGTVSVYSEQVTTSNNNFYSFSDSTISGSFAVNDSPNEEGAGIAPFDPAEGGASTQFQSQDGITDVVNGNSNYGNVLLVELGSNIAQGTTLKFMLEAGDGDNNVQTYSANFYTSDTTANVPSVGISPSGMTLSGTAAAGTISTFGNTPQVTLTKNTSGVEWVAIEADCHYMLLSSITGAPPTSGVPEPRFYGMLLASLLGLAGVVYQRRRAGQTVA
jgi:hypothetical protein